ncbi:hypothetical protein LR48_Vigan272s002600 [Vigna angularis]|uniref:Uncharacterized protein n=1 Tax=Phaseolus angularis TaxID=3914 RepID=A0A0L9T798_PHAAN|nr:hypothetical protein LR48_Vigan272s002600 [Vigna angularis]
MLAARAVEMRDMYMSLMDARMEALYRGQMAVVEMISRLYDPPKIRHRMSMDEFRARMAWPEDPAHADGGDAADEDEDSDDY